MTYIIPDTVLRLQAEAFVHNRELEAVGGTGLMRTAAGCLSEKAVRKLMDMCIEVEDAHGFTHKRLRLDCYVLSPSELNGIISKAVERGMLDAMRWNPTGMWGVG